MPRTTSLQFIASTLLLITPCAGAAETPSAGTGQAASWELKGIHLGESTEAVKTLLPNASCTSKPSDAGIVVCVDDKNSVGGEVASVAVKLLDGHVVSVAIENLTYEQAYSACAPLTQKFGPATFVDRVMVKLKRGRYVETEKKERCTWRDGEMSLFLDPDDWTSEKKQFTYSAIILMDEAKHNREWVIRYNAKGSPSDF